MSEFQLSHIALVGARISSFAEYGFNSRNELKMRRIAPLSPGETLEELSQEDQEKRIASLLPLWIHNIITDEEFPGRAKLLMPLRRFEGELKDKKDNEVVSAVMSAGFKSQNFNPLDLPKTMTMRRRCSIVAHIGVWQEAYQRLEEEIVSVLSAEAPAIAQWCELARQPGNATIEAA